MKQRSSFSIIAMTMVVVAGFLVASDAYAMTPTLSLSSLGNNSVQVNVSGDPNSNVMFYYNVASASGMQTMTLGSTNSSGYFSTTIDASSYGINAGQSVYTVVNGQQSAMQMWPSPSGVPTLNETSVTLGLGQSTTVYSQGSSAAVYMASNSNPSIASVTTNGTDITVMGNQIGQTTVSICYAGTASNCTSLNVTVQAGSVLSFSQNNFSLSVGQGTTVTVTGGSGSYSITGNSNPSAASAVLSGNVITMSGIAVGSVNIAVCDTSGNCGTIYVTVGGTTNGSLYFSSSNPSLTVGQTIMVTISGGSDYYITGNSNPSVVSQTLNGSTLTLSGIESGTATITVCSTSNGCGTLYVTVAFSSTNGGQVTFGVTNPTVTAGQSMSVSLSGGSSYYVSSNESSNVVEPSINGSTLTLYGETAGSDSLIVCVTGGSCSTLYVTVAAQSTSVQSTSPTTLLAAIQSMQAQLAQLVTQIQTMATTLTQLAASASGTTATPTGNATSGNTSSYTFTQFLSAGSQGADVTALQQYLTQKGFYSGPITGFYGSLTEVAVEHYQTAHGIDPAGYVGPSTRAALNAGE